MPCYHPMLSVKCDAVNEKTGKNYRKIVGSYDPILEDEYRLADPIAVPCGNCIGCRMDHSRRWADRMMLELDHTGKGVFVTLTYNDENLPDKRTLVKKDFQDFMKRLRSRKEFENTEIRFYACGEYGSKTFRPHYHVILFGIDLDSFGPRKFLSKNELGQPHYTSKLLEEIWSKGFVVITEVSWNTFAYVSRYVLKKLNGPMSEIYEDLDILPEFSLMSRRPGIGAYYMDDHKDWLEHNKYFLKGHEISMPELFLKSLELTNPELYDKMKRDRKKFAKDRQMSKLMQTDLYLEEMLERDEKNHQKVLPLLPRNLA